jgi:hypothetical protein
MAFGGAAVIYDLRLTIYARICKPTRQAAVLAPFAAGRKSYIVNSKKHSHAKAQRRKVFLPLDFPPALISNHRVVPMKILEKFSQPRNRATAQPRNRATAQPRI